MSGGRGAQVMSTLMDLLRAPGEIARRCREDDGVRELAAASLGAAALGAAAFGGVIGAFRGELQIVWSAAKLPLALLATLALCVPAFHALAAVLGRPWPVRTIVTMVLAAVARAGLVLLALSPVVWLAIDWGLDYHDSVLLATGAYGVAGLAALGLLLRGLGAGAGRIATALAFGAVLLAAGGQTAWSLRPYLGRPAHDSVPFVRAPEGGFADSVVTSAKSAVGIYERASRRSPGGSMPATQCGRDASCPEGLRRPRGRR